MKSQTALRKRIETTIGRQVLEKYCLKDETLGPLMMPPIPDSKFIDKLPEGGMLEHTNGSEKDLQDAYIAEVKL